MKRALPILVCAALAGPARADDKSDAAARYEKGLELYTAKEYPKAIGELKAAYDLDDKPEYLYALAQAVRLSGNCVGALPLYKEFLDKFPTHELAAPARDLVKLCEESVKPPEPPAPATAPPPPKPAPVPDDRRAWWKDPIGGALVGTGAVALGVGVTFWILSSSSEKDAQAADTYQDYKDHIEKAQSRRTIAIASLVAGTALVGGGVARYLMLPKARGKEPAALSFYFDGAEGGLVVAGEF
jgi:tetratricopeptide (TPR) repeat protein